ncbi:histidine phosphatase family protein [Nocardioides sp.]|uniref:histidine phosphatase family protein n=1 Tax=Nocardioides sp. TaxID=35761 RepID=UPI003526DC0E
MELFLVRHAMPEVDPHRSPDSWRLSREGRIAARALRADLPRTPTAVSSPEIKAVETLALGIDRPADRIVTDDGFAEVLRPGEPFDDEVAARRRAWVEGRLDGRHDGWETPGEAATRMQSAIDRHRPERAALVVATHGMAMTAWLTACGHVADGAAAGEFWSQLRFPDVIRLGI